MFANRLSAHCLSGGVKSVDEQPVVQIVIERTALNIEHTIYVARLLCHSGH